MSDIQNYDYDESPISFLQDEIMILIFQFIYSSSNIHILPYVCKRWRTICYTLPIELNIPRLQLNVFDIFATIKYFNNINSLVFNTNMILNLDRFPLGSGLTNITKLSYIGNKYDYRVIKIVPLIFKYYKYLTTIKVEFSGFNIDDLIEIIASNKNITSINLWGTRINMVSFTRFIKNGTLTSLKKLKYNSYLFKKYRYIAKEDCDLFFMAISTYCPNIEWLDVRYTGITIKGLTSLKKCKNLKYLNILGSYKITNKMIKKLNAELPDTIIILKKRTK
jgi:hypothetical protein